MASFIFADGGVVCPEAVVTLASIPELQDPLFHLRKSDKKEGGGTNDGLSCCALIERDKFSGR